jgi:Cu-Zn family superoxide dismutase
VVGVACQKRVPDAGAAPEDIREAVAVMHPTEGNTTHGIVRFSQVPDGVRIIARIEGLAPDSKHGFHIHQFGDFSSGDASSAGGHYNPEGHRHGGPSEPERHAGDLGNLEAGPDGVAHYEFVADNMTISGHRNPILGRGLVIHAGADDLASQPTGNAGARIAFGVIGVAGTIGR